MKNAKIIAISGATLTMRQGLLAAVASAVLVMAAVTWQKAQAQDAPVAPPSMATPLAEAPSPAVTAPPAPAAAMAPTVPQEAPVATGAPALMDPAVVANAPVPMPAQAQPMSASNIPTPTVDLPPGTPSAVGQVMKDLQKAQQGISVDDMARAEDALARLDLMLAIQKKLKEYKEVQEKQSGSDGFGMASNSFGMPSGGAPMPVGNMGAAAIPASALSLPPAGLPVASAPMAKVKTPAAKNSSYEVQQISGANGNMSAVLITDEGERKTVRIGDDLDGQKVTNISADGVQIRSAKGTVKTISVQNDGFALTPFAR